MLAAEELGYVFRDTDVELELEPAEAAIELEAVVPEEADDDSEFGTDTLAP